MPGPDQRPRSQQQIDPLRDDQLADEDDSGRSVPARGSCRGGGGPAGSPRAVLDPPPPRHPRKRRPRAESFGVDAGRTEASLLLEAKGIGQSRPQRLGRVPRADEDAVRGLHALSRIGQEAGIGFDRVLQCRAVDLGGEVSDVGAGENRRTHDQMIRQSQVDASSLRSYGTDSFDVCVEIAVQLLLAQFGEALDLEALVWVLDVDGEQAVDVGVVDLDPLDLRLLVLAQKVDLVAELGQRPGQVGVVDVAAGAAQHVAVEDQDSHEARRLPQGKHCYRAAR